MLPWFIQMPAREQALLTHFAQVATHFCLEVDFNELLALKDVDTPEAARFGLHAAQRLMVAPIWTQTPSFETIARALSAIDTQDTLVVPAQALMETPQVFRDLCEQHPQRLWVRYESDNLNGTEAQIPKQARALLASFGLQTPVAGVLWQSPEPLSNMALALLGEVIRLPLLLAPMMDVAQGFAIERACLKNVCGGLLDLTRKPTLTPEQFASMYTELEQQIKGAKRMSYY